MAAVMNRTSFASFCDGKEPTFIFEDDLCVAFDETQRNKQAPVHFLVVPKKVIPRLVSASLDDEKLLGHLLIVVRRVAKWKNLHNSGFRVVINEGPNSCQLVDQFYIQVLGGRQMGWPFS
ncbi:histidine triad nucleotide-binding protein 2, mitochondrial-like isoform X2 [Trichoplusia ni]|uniref:Histidine triad nucleotide-binding protein 2, mitochondrial-like isoform X2 n=1 Tax=Trichoplusia ni TaxID=7111 RepID=A0A7E5WMU1_TRINI|nr:histidine triad nucleotide-binding protein 2, mitochondrial-like isoform X2 [Trichoplusia ni]